MRVLKLRNSEKIDKIKSKFLLNGIPESQSADMLVTYGNTPAFSKFDQNSVIMAKRRGCAIVGASAFCAAVTRAFAMAITVFEASLYNFSIEDSVEYPRYLVSNSRREAKMESQSEGHLKVIFHVPFHLPSTWRPGVGVAQLCVASL